MLIVIVILVKGLWSGGFACLFSLAAIILFFAGLIMMDKADSTKSSLDRALFVGLFVLSIGCFVGVCVKIAGNADNAGGSSSQYSPSPNPGKVPSVPPSFR